MDDFTEIWNILVGRIVVVYMYLPEINTYFHYPTSGRNLTTYAPLAPNMLPGRAIATGAVKRPLKPKGNRKKSLTRRRTVL